jgi:hypothetical protein
VHVVFWLVIFDVGLLHIGCAAEHVPVGFVGLGWGQVGVVFGMLTAEPAHTVIHSPMSQNRNPRGDVACIDQVVHMLLVYTRRKIVGAWFLSYI